MCSICKSKWETIDHVLCGYKQAKVVCNSMFKRVDAEIPIINNFADRVMWLAKHLDSESFGRACITFWSLWNDGNNYHNNVPIMNWPQRCEWICDYWL